MSTGPPAAPPAAPSPAPPVFSGGAFTKPQARGKRIAVYGTGGVGKTSFALAAPGQTVFVDLENSLADLGEMETPVLDVPDFATLIAKLNDHSIWDGVDNIVLDSMTVAQTWAESHVLTTIPKDDGSTFVTNLKAYGWNAGSKHLYDQMSLLIDALERHTLDGRNVITIAHDITANVPNPGGDDFIRFEPRLNHDKQWSIRLMWKERNTHLLFMGYMQNVTKHDKKDRTGKAAPGNTSVRQIIAAEQPHIMAKGRNLKPLYNINTHDYSAVWKDILSDS